MTVTAREIHLKSRPEGLPTQDNFELVERRLEEPREGQLLVRNLWMSVDPYMRGRMRDRKSYIPPFQIGQPLDGNAVGIVEASTVPGFAPGDRVSHFTGWRDYALVDAKGATRIDEKVAPLQAFLGPLGVPGFTAYIGLELAKAQAGNTVFVSGAAGAVGVIACQIARIKGCKVIASAGSDEKIAWLRDKAGVDGTINYRTAGNFEEALAKVSPNGIDVYFDNVGGAQLDAALGVANDFARFALCGMIEQYNDEAPPPGPRNMFQAVLKRLTLQGFLVTDYLKRMPEFTREMAQWIADGKIQSPETVVKGLELAPKAFLGLFSGDNLGKMLVDLR
ncbi:NADP-dependent oxidoreductase [Pendulispora albinea]|uniref:NADP-dependent oxidoreductase n=1 Tax=Pendulispora albinea TaxID=2741071 RepID=A0ABZ2M083_9BACT